jgi:hypothetical protein
VTVFLDPLDPATALLIPGPTEESVKLAKLGSLVFLIGLVGLAYRIRNSG